MRPRRSIASRLASLRGLAAAACLSAGGLAVSCAPPAPPGDSLAVSPDSGEVYGPVADFRLTERSGREVALADLRGRTWIVDFFFTTCSGPCPLITANVRKLQDELAGTPIRLVSISVDPENDTLPALRAYADAVGADPGRWLFLTGEEGAIYSLMRDSFHLAVERASSDDFVFGQQVSHATRLVVVDREGHVRGYYEGTTEEGRQAARERALAVEGIRPRSRLPAVNALLNGMAALLLLAGLRAIRSGNRQLHERLMKTAFVVSAAFLATYLYYHLAVARGQPTRWNREGAALYAYYALLLSHTALAVVNLPMVLRTLYLAHAGRWPAHKRLARWTFPIWLYVSVTGVLVYVVLYHLNLPAPAPAMG